MSQKKLTLEPSKIWEGDMDLVKEAGWSEEALHQAILIGCLFNFYNRLLDGHGVKGNKKIYRFAGDHLHKNGYSVPWFIGSIKGFVKRSKMKKLEELEMES